MAGINDRPDWSTDYRGLFICKITDVQPGYSGGNFAGLYLHSWIEQRYDITTGSPVDSETPRYGRYTPGPPEVAVSPLVEPNNAAIPVGTYVWCRVKGYANNVLVYETVGSVGDTFLAVLVGKCYPTTSGGSGASTNCAPDGSCGGRYIQYSWIRVKDSGADPGPPCPIAYAELPQCGGPGCSPAYHSQNLDLAVWPGGSTLPCCGTDSGDGRTFSVAPHSVVRLRKGLGDYYLIDQSPWEDLFRRTGDSDDDGEIVYLRYYDQNDGVWKDGEECRLVEAE